MKKTLFLCIVILSFAISSCKKDSSNPTPANFSGTTWKSDDNSVRIEFTSTTQLKFILPGEITSLQVTNGIYTIDKNNITIQLPESPDINGIIDGNTITFMFGSRVIVLKKQ